MEYSFFLEFSLFLLKTENRELVQYHNLIVRSFQHVIQAECRLALYAIRAASALPQETHSSGITWQRYLRFK